MGTVEDVALATGEGLVWERTAHPARGRSETGGECCDVEQEGVGAGQGERDGTGDREGERAPDRDPPSHAMASAARGMRASRMGQWIRAAARPRAMQIHHMRS